MDTVHLPAGFAGVREPAWTMTIQEETCISVPFYGSERR